MKSIDKNILTRLLLFCLLFFTKYTDAQIITTLAGNGSLGFGGDGGSATASILNGPHGIAFDKFGNLYIADVNNNRIRKITSSGIITTFAGNGSAGFSGDGGQATLAELNSPYGVAVDTSGNVYIADALNNRVRIVDTFGVINTIAGNGIYGANGDGGQATLAAISHPMGVAVDINGNVYIPDINFNLIRKVNGSGIITTFAGNGTIGFDGDGGIATSAKLNHPAGIAIDDSSNIYIVDQSNSRIRKVNTSGIISTIAGTGIPGGYSGDGGQATAAEINLPRGVTIDELGNIYIADEYNFRVRMINNSGIINTVAGNGNDGFSGDGGPATNGELSFPCGVAVNQGKFYIADYNNNRIRMVSNVENLAKLINKNERFNFYPNPANDQFFIETRITEKLKVELYDVNGRNVYTDFIYDKSSFNVANFSNGTYILTIKITDEVIHKKLVILH